MRGVRGRPVTFDAATEARALFHGCLHRKRGACVGCLTTQLARAYAAGVVEARDPDGFEQGYAAARVAADRLAEAVAVRPVHRTTRTVHTARGVRYDPVVELDAAAWQCLEDELRVYRDAGRRCAHGR